VSAPVLTATERKALMEMARTGLRPACTTQTERRLIHKGFVTLPANDPDGRTHLLTESGWAALAPTD
jgi:hypothetical protein